jgi:hypothetical protein
MSLKTSALILLVAAPWSSLACRATRPSPRSTELSRSCYAVMDGQPVHSTMVSMQTHGTERLIGMTELDSGERLVEEATIDESGQLIEAEATLTPAASADAGADAQEPAAATHVVFHPARKTVELTTPVLHMEWSVPNDLPWVWAPLLTVPTVSAAAAKKSRPIATPLDARVALRAAQNGRAVRLLDLGALEQHTLTADQLVIPDGADATVVIGDDVIDVENGTARRLHLAALDVTLELLDARAPSTALVAALRCTDLSGALAR